MNRERRLPRVFESFDQVSIINLRERVDRRQDMLREIERVGLDRHPSLSFFDAIKRDDAGPFLRVGSHGAFDSYVGVLESAVRNGNSVLVLQDDCRFTRAVHDEINIEGVDLFYGGWRALDRGPVERSAIVGAHCMGFTCRTARLALDYLADYKSPDFAADSIACSEPGYDNTVRPPIDGALVWFRRANPSVRTLFHRIALQRSSPSSISPSHTFPHKVMGQVKRFFVGALR